MLLKEEDSVASIIIDKLKLDKIELMHDIEEIFNFFGDKVDESPYPFLINLSSSNGCVYTLIKLQSLIFSFAKVPSHENAVG